MIVALCLLAMMSFVIFMSDPNAFVKGGTGVTYESLRLAIPFMVLIGLTFLCEWLVYKLRKQSAPETADIQVAAGEAAVVMLRLLPSMGILLKLELRFRERWCESAGGSMRWHETDEYRQGLSFTQQSPTLAVVHVDIPRDAEGSYDSPQYKLEWILAVTHQPRRSRPRTDEFALWVTARSVFRSD
jgi:hypothetical protein